MHVCVWYTELTCISNGASKTDIRVRSSVCVCVSACMLVCVWYTEPTCIPYWASRTDIVGQVLGPSMCCRAPLTTGVDILPQYCALVAGSLPLQGALNHWGRILPQCPTIQNNQLKKSVCKNTDFDL